MNELIQTLKDILKSWLFIRNMNIERYLYTAQRITGIILLFFLIVHTIVKFSLLLGKEKWETLMDVVSMKNVFVDALIFLLVLCVIFHALNGVRLLLCEFGFLIGNPKRPVYPYKASSLSKPRILLIILMMIGIIILIISFFAIFKYYL